MSKPRFCFGLTLVSFVVCLITDLTALTGEEPAAMRFQQGTRTAASPDEVAIRQSAAAFAKLFNAGDAKAIAARWTEDGEYVNEYGQRFVGRQAIQKEYEEFFAQFPGTQIQVKVDSVKMISPEVAIAEGTATLGTADAPAPISSRYIVVRVKRNNEWLTASARDLRVEVTSNHSKFADFEKLIGDWSYQHGSTHVMTTCRWIANKKYIERRFSVSENGAVTHSGKQIIGWNPMEQQITSWLFDSSGGHDFAVWSPQEKGWVSQSNGFTADGTPTSATNLLTHADGNSMTWKSINRTLGDEPLADTGELVLKRVATSTKGR